MSMSYRFVFRSKVRAQKFILREYASHWLMIKMHILDPVLLGVVSMLYVVLILT